MHLTNYALNKENTDFKQAKTAEDPSAHKRTIKTVYERLRKDGKDVEKLERQIDEIIIKTILTI
jgi:tubulin polyglutamylase TTLL6/13